MTRHLGVDLGAESGRCIVATLDNGKLTLDELCRFPTQGLQVLGETRWNIYRFYEEILKGLKEYVHRYGIVLDSIGVDTWGVDYGFLDKNGKILDLPYSYRDSRIKNSGELLEKYRETIYAKTGVQFLELNTINQLVSAKKAGNIPLECANNLLFIADLLHYMLGSDIVTEYTVASTSQLVNTHKKEWDDELITLFELPINIKTKIVFAGECIGNLSKAICDDVGLTCTVKIIAPPVHDTASAIVAIPTLQQDDWAYISSGTWSLAGVELDEVLSGSDAMALNVSNSGGAFGKNLLLKNVMGLWLIQQCKRQWNKTNPNLDYAEIVRLALATPPLQQLIDPDRPEFYNPDNMPVEICNYLIKTNQAPLQPDNIAEIARVIYESLSLKYRYVFERISALTGKKISVLHIIGGGSKNDLLNQMVASAMGITVNAGPDEATVIGNTLVQAYGCGEVSSLAEIRKIVYDFSKPKVFQPIDSIHWNKAYERFLLLL